MIKQFPEYDNYSLDDLILIAHIEKDNWQSDAVEYALSLLKKRNISDSDIQKRIIELNNVTQALIQAEVETLKTESYGFRDLLYGFLFWPIYLISGWNLKKDGYLLKAKQRLYFIRVGIPLYLIFIILSNLSFEKNDQQNRIRIKKATIVDSLAISAVDWSGSYCFIDSSTTNSDNRAIWELILLKDYPHHSGIIKISNKDVFVEIACTGVIKGNDIELYPDTTYIIFNDTKISYYDKLLSLERREKYILTHWFKMKPLYISSHSDKGIFKEVTACNKVYKK